MGKTKDPHHAILGTLYGQAVGDAMRMPSELWPLQRVRDYFGRITYFLPGPEENIAANGFVAGEFTDDTQQAVALMDALLASKGRHALYGLKGKNRGIQSVPLLCWFLGALCGLMMTKTGFIDGPLAKGLFADPSQGLFVSFLASLFAYGFYLANNRGRQ